LQNNNNNNNVLPQNPTNLKKKKELNVLDAKIRASADMKNKTADNIYKTF
jgi:hypothetical protein